MSQKPSARTVPQLFDIEPEELDLTDEQAEMADRKGEARRVVKRLANLVVEHHEASKSLGITLGAKEVRKVIDALRDHAKGGNGDIDLRGCDEIMSHCLRRLYEELVEEPSNILFTTTTGKGSVRYDAMDSRFWVECLDLLEISYLIEK